AGAEQRLEDAVVVALVEERRVVVGGVPAHHDDLRVGHMPGGDAGLQSVAHDLADGHIVKAHVVRPAAAEGAAVVVDDLHPLSRSQKRLNSNSTMSYRRRRQQHRPRWWPRWPASNLP